jgi:hypothetical protein
MGVTALFKIIFPRNAGVRPVSRRPLQVRKLLIQIGAIVTGLHSRLCVALRGSTPGIATFVTHEFVFDINS